MVAETDIISPECSVNWTVITRTFILKECQSQAFQNGIRSMLFQSDTLKVAFCFNTNYFREMIHIDFLLQDMNIINHLEHRHWVRVRYTSCVRYV